MIESKNDVPLLIDMNVWNLDLLVDYVVKEYYLRIEDNINSIRELFERELLYESVLSIQIRETTRLFKSISREISQRIMSERKDIFLYIKTISNQDNSQYFKFNNQKTLKQIIKKFNLNYKLRFLPKDEIDNLIQNLTVIKFISNRLAVVFIKVTSIHRDIEELNEIRNVILFPRSVQQEKKFLNCF
ncbi:MAG: hypothetical protein COB15_01310 [Flavobacteriales bacterium]|nr:MAG: hypothetical protein COB15_01310 [Flavobacteriales bacterium]